MNVPTVAGGPPDGKPHDPYAALRIRNVRLFLTGSVIANTGLQMQSVAVLWEIYKRTGSAHGLAMVGLVQVVPVVLLTLIAGHVADRFRRQWIVMASISLIALASVGLALVSISHAPISALYGCLLLSAVGRAFHQPAKSSLLPQLVPRDKFSNAVNWGMTGFQLSSVLGPALGGQLIASFASPAIVYLVSAGASLTYVVLMFLLRDVTVVRSTTGVTFGSLLAGFVFVCNRPVILAALALDLFAVLLGGATTLLPIYALDILKVGPTGYGLLEAAPAVGAMLMAVVMAHRPPLRHAGRALLLAVAGFGLATIVFGLSHNFWLSWAMFFLTGACDNVSVVVRHTLVQLLTPDDMRGRVSAVNGMFIGASNELGGFESGEVAEYFGAIVSVVAGGLGTLTVVALVALLCPQLRRYGRVDGSSQASALESGPDVAPRDRDRPGVTPLVSLLPPGGQSDAGAES
jgi:MFS family permease